MAKKKICVECGKESYIFSKKRCQLCASKTYKKPKQVFKPKVNKVDIDNYFVDRITELNKLKKSEESGDPILYPTRTNICHLVNKRNHGSVAYHPLNYVFLTWDEHSELDSKCLDVNDFVQLQKRFPNSFELIIERLRVVMQSVTERTKFVEAFEKFNETLTF